MAADSFLSVHNVVTIGYSVEDKDSLVTKVVLIRVDIFATINGSAKKKLK